MLIADELCDRVAFINNGKIVAMDTPRSLKLQFGERSVQVEYVNGSGVDRQVFFLDRPEDHQAFIHVMTAAEVQTVHSQEATLEQIFIKLTGRGLS
jgi:fluoroquinolone transport system ATP-binding protein